MAARTGEGVVDRGSRAQALVILLAAALWALLVQSRPSGTGPDGPEGPITVWGTTIPPAGVDGATPVVLELYTEHGGRTLPRARIETRSATPFRFKGLAAGIHHLVATSGGLYAATTLAVTGRGSCGPFILALEASCSVSGRITGAAGAPVQATVEIQPEPVQGDPTAGRTWFARRVSRAGPDGRFSVSGLPSTSCRLTIHAADHAAATLARVHVPGPEVSIRLTGLGGLRVEVLGGAREGEFEPVPGAELRVFSPGTGQSMQSPAGPDGRATFSGLLPGTYYVEARSGSMLSYSPAEVLVEELGMAGVSVRIRPSIAIEGVVRDSANGRPVDGACIVASSRGETSRLACGASDVEGRFRIAGLAPGKYALVAQAAGYLRERPPLVAIGAEGLASTLELAMDRSMQVSGRVIDSSGRPVEGARIMADDARKLSSSLLDAFVDLHLPSVGPGDPGLLAIGELGVTLGPVPPIPLDPLEVPEAKPRAEPLPEGCACLMDQPQDTGRGSLSGPDGAFVLAGIAPGEISLLVVHGDFATLRSEPLAIRPGEDPDPVLLVLEPGGTIGGRVLDAQGFPVPGAHVWIEGPSTFLAQPMEVDAQGRWQADHVAGDLTVSASCPGYFPATRTTFLPPSTSILEFDLVLEPEGARVRARVTDPWGFPVEEALITITSGKGSEAISRSLRSDEDGMFCFPSLPGTSWAVVAAHPSWRTLRTVLGPWEPWDEPVLTMGFAAGVSGTVRDGWSYLPMEEFTLTVLKEGEPLARRTFRGGGFSLVDLPPGECTLRFEAEIYETLTKVVSLPSGGGPTEVTLPDLELWMDPLDPGA